MNTLRVLVAAAAVAVLASAAVAADQVKVRIGAKVSFVEGQGGATILEIMPGGLAEANLKKGDKILEVNDIPINGEADVKKVNESTVADGAVIKVLFSRDGQLYVAKTGVLIKFNSVTYSNKGVEKKK